MPMENATDAGSRSNGNGASSIPAPHVAMLATPGMGHLIPLAELAKRLAARHGVTSTLITFASTSSSAAQRALLASLPPSAVVESLALPPVDLSDLTSFAGGATAAIETLMSEECARSLPALTETLLALKRRRRRLAAFVTDLFGADAFEAARAAGVRRRYLFFPANLHALTLMLHLPELDATVAGEFRDLPEPLRLPGCVPLPATEAMNPLQDRSDPSYRWMVHHGATFRTTATAILVNSFAAVEPGPADVLLHARHQPPVRAVGPLVRAADDDDGDDCPCLQWLDRQPARSVIFVSFGSGGTLPAEEMRELALGLELSGQRFLWVARSPTSEGAAGAGNDNYYDSASKKDPFVYLPPGFLERTTAMDAGGGRGLVVPSWAPQARVLAHAATGGFLTHCGWNSALESLVHGVPMLAWPLFADQRQNAVLLCDGVGAALRAPRTKRREDIAAAVRELMSGDGGEGAAVRAKVEELRKAAAETLRLRDGGAAAAALAEVAKELTGREEGDDCLAR